MKAGRTFFGQSAARARCVAALHCAFGMRGAQRTAATAVVHPVLHCIDGWEDWSMPGNSLALQSNQNALNTKVLLYVRYTDLT